jgi:hypothetical protein
MILRRLWGCSIGVTILLGCGGSVDLLSPTAGAGSDSNDDDSETVGGNGGGRVDPGDPGGELGFGGAGGSIRGGAGGFGGTRIHSGGNGGADHNACGGAYPGGTFAYGTRTCVPGLPVAPPVPPVDRGWGGNGPLPQLEGWIAYDVIDPLGAGRHIELRAADGHCTRVVTEDLREAKHPAFSHETGALAYAARRFESFQIEVRNLATGLIVVVTDLEDGATYPSWSPDGRRIVFAAGDPERRSGSNEIGVVDLESLRVETLAIVPRPSTSSGFVKPIFADDDTILVGNHTSLVAVTWSTQEVRNVVPITGRIPNPNHPTLAPDGQHFAFTDYCGDFSRIYQAKVDGSTGDTCDHALPLTPFAAGPMVTPAWGPFGFLAAVEGESNFSDSRSTIVLFPEDGSGYGMSRVYVDSGKPGNPAWADPGFGLNCDE